MKTKIGGQAVLEGVMMRGATSEALSCRDEMGVIRTETKRLPAKKAWYKKVPFLRGVVNLVISMIDGTKIIGKSAELLVEEVDANGNDNSMSWIMAISTLLGFALAMVLFVVVPTAVTTGVMSLFNLDETQFAWLKSLLEGVTKMLVLVAYMAGISQMKEIKRVFMYHGAEHKTIACYESELPLTVQNVQKCSRYHDRCGTSFLVFVVVLSIVLMMALDVICVSLNFTMFVQKQNWWLRALLKIALLPLTAGISYEVLMLLAKSNFVLFRPLKWLGKQFQRITTKEPDDQMCEVAITSFVKVLQMDEDASIPCESFPEPVSLEQFTQYVAQSALGNGKNESFVKWLTCAILNVKPNQLTKQIKIPFGWLVRVDKMCQRYADGEPLQYVVERAEFFDRNYVVNKNVLVPRQETELVAEQMIKVVKKGDKVLDMCCGSGVLGLTACLNGGAKVTLVDVDKKAIKVAKTNARLLKAKAKFVVSNMFEKVTGKYDVVVCNPPYVVSADIETLDKSVKDYEPRLALDGGQDGLDFYRVLAKEAPNFLNKNGKLVLEVGYDQGERVVQLLSTRFDAQYIKDYSNNDRIVVATLR